MPSRVLFATLSLVALSSCTFNSVEGTVDGLEIPAIQSTALAIIEDEANDANILVAFFTTFPDACTELKDTFEVVADVGDPDNTPDDIEDLRADFVDVLNRPDRLGQWTFQVTAIAESTADFRSDKTFEIDEDGEGNDERALLNALIQEREAEVNDDGTLEAGQDSFDGDSGTFVLQLAENLGSLDIEATVDLRDEDGDRAGEVTLTGTAVFCDGLAGTLADALGL